MRKASIIEKETQQIITVEDLTAVFESIASAQIAKIKDRVELAQEFFDLLWKRYSAIRIDPESRITNRDQEGMIDKKVFVIISAEAGLSGDIDERLLETMTRDYHADTTDIIILGTHGANQLKDHRIPFIRYFKVPESDSYIDVGPIIDAIRPYKKATIYYEEYVSLGVQEIKKLDLFSTIKAMSEAADTNEDTITDRDTIFEPSLDDIADLMEKGMMALAFGQAILESRLAQAASRFSAMAAAKKRAWELIHFHLLEGHRAKRAESDRRMHEVLIGIKKKKKRLARQR
jgi:ATP synthase F1 gamma subunit